MKWQLLPVFLSLSCGGPQTSSVSLALKGEGGPDAQGNGLVVDGARAFVRHIELGLPDGRTCADYSAEELGGLVCDGDDLRIAGPFVVDLKTGEAEPPLDAVRIPAGTYRRVDVRLDDAENLDAQDALTGLTIVATGSLDYSGRPTPFEIALDFDEDARFERADGITLDQDAGAEILLWLDTSVWFATLPITECIDEGDLRIGPDGTLRMTDQAGDCSDIENAMKDAIKSSGQLDRR